MDTLNIQGKEYHLSEEQRVKYESIVEEYKRELRAIPPVELTDKPVLTATDKHSEVSRRFRDRVFDLLGIQKAIQ